MSGLGFLIKNLLILQYTIFLAVKYENTFYTVHLIIPDGPIENLHLFDQYFTDNSPSRGFGYT